MGKTLSDLSPPAGARKRPKRVGRGDGSRWGTTAGRGQKGQTSRSGSGRRPWFEGGQMPLQRRLPKRGFRSPFRKEYAAVNLDRLALLMEQNNDLSLVDGDFLKSNGVIPRTASRWKVLGRGQLTRSVTVHAQAFSQRAREQIEAVGGTAQLIRDVSARAPQSSDDADTDVTA